VTGDKLKLYFLIGKISGSYRAQTTKVVTSASVGARTYRREEKTRIAFLARCAILHDPPQLARLVVGELPGPSVKLCLRHRGALLPPA
jgi:hypothetical protein